jgi:hypothetical protein
MTMPVADLIMPKKRKQTPQGPGPLSSRYVILASQKHREWMVGFMEHINEVDVSDVFREAVRRWAEEIGYDAPPRR